MRLLAERGDVAQDEAAAAEAPPPPVPSALWICGRTPPDSKPPAAPWHAFKRRRRAGEDGAGETITVPVGGSSSEAPLQKEDRETVEVLRQLLVGAEPQPSRQCAS